jgi:hypothetical protein
MAAALTQEVLLPNGSARLRLYTGTGTPSDTPAAACLAVVGADEVYRFDGASWYQVLSGSSTVTSHPATATSSTSLVGAVQAVSIAGGLAPAAASNTAVHAGYAGNSANNNFPGPFTSPDYPRTASVTSGAGYDGGAVTLTGTDQFDVAQTEAINPPGGGGTQNGVKVFKTITAAVKAAVGANPATASIGTGNALGLPKRITIGAGLLSVSGKDTAGSTWSSAVHSVQPDGAVLPNGARTYSAMVPVTETHTHNTPILAHTVTA